MARRLMRGGHEVVAFDLNQDSVKRLGEEGAATASSLGDAVAQLASPRVVGVSACGAAPTERVVEELGEQLGAGDVIIDGGNTYLQGRRPPRQRARPEGHPLRRRGARAAACGDRPRLLPHGGRRPSRRSPLVQPILRDARAGTGDIPRTPGRQEVARAARTARRRRATCTAARSAPALVKMVHNAGIEHGLMQAYAEGFDILKNAATGAPRREEHRYGLTRPRRGDRRGVASRQRGGPWLLDLTGDRPSPESLELAGYRRASCRTRRGPLDRDGGDRGGRPRRGAVLGALRALPLTATITPSPRRSSPRCGTSSAGTWSAPTGAEGEVDGQNRPLAALPSRALHRPCPEHSGDSWHEPGGCSSWEEALSSVGAAEPQAVERREDRGPAARTAATRQKAVENTASGAGKDGGGCPNHYGGRGSGKIAQGDPVDVVTGRVFTLSPRRMSTSRVPFLSSSFGRTAARRCGAGRRLGFGWTWASLAWATEPPTDHHRRHGRRQRGGIDSFRADAGVLGPHGWVLHKEGDGFSLDCSDGDRLLPEPDPGRPHAASLPPGRAV